MDYWQLRMRDIQEMETSSQNSASLVRRYSSTLLSLQRRRALLACCLMVATSFLSGFGLLVLLPLLQLVGIGTQPSEIAERVTGVFDWLGLARTLPNVLFSFFLLITGHTLLARWMNLANMNVEKSFARSLQNRLYSAIMQTDWIFFVRTRRSDLIHSLTDNVNRISLGTMFAFRFLSSLVVSTLYLTLSLLISPVLTVVTLSCFLVFWFLLRPYNRSARQTGQALMKLNKRFYADITEHLAGMKEAKSLGSEQHYIDLFKRNTGAIRDAFLRFTHTRVNTTLVYRIGSAGLLSILLFFAVEILRVPLIELVLLVVIFGKLLPRLHQINNSYQETLHMLPAFASFIEGLEHCHAARELQPDPGPRPLDLEREIRLRDVEFSYQRGEGKPVLRGLE